MEVEGPVRIIDIGEGDKFTLHEPRLRTICAHIPPGLKVSVVSVVGAFRQGKSFLLDLMLRYLRYYDTHPDAVASWEHREWMQESDAPLAGAANTTSSAPVPASSFSSQFISGMSRDAAGATAEAAATSSAAAAATSSPAAVSGFGWRGGAERTTTGIWMWSRPFIRKLPRTEEHVAVILMDTQGMFDGETTQMLTTTIFGLSTLISSFVVYNLSGLIGEDHLQHLALFSEYGRRAQEELDMERRTTALKATGAATGSTRALLTRAASTRGSSREGAALPPFQHIRLLVRDADKAMVDVDVGDRVALQAHMARYLDGVLSRNKYEDLATVRNHIRMCFESIDCYTLPHPGKIVFKKEFDGRTSALDPEFNTVLHYFMHSLFCEDLTIKRVNDQFITARELPVYMAQYARLFQNPSIFPEARVLLDATAEACALTALEAASTRFDEEVEAYMSSSFVTDPSLQEHMRVCRDTALELFDEKANFGSHSIIEKHRMRLEEVISERCADFMTRNKERNPLNHLEMFLLPLAIAVVAWFLRIVSDWTCAPYSSVCARGSQFFTFVYTAIFFAVVIVFARSGKAAWDRVTAIYRALSALVPTDFATQPPRALTGGVAAPRPHAD